MLRRISLLGPAWGSVLARKVKLFAKTPLNDSGLESLGEIDHWLFPLDAALVAARQPTTFTMLMTRHLTTTKALRQEWLAGDVCPKSIAMAAAGTAAQVTIKGNRRHSYAITQGRGTN